MSRREQLAQNPVRDITGFGTYNLPPGSFSDDSSMTFCLAESLATGFSTETMAAHFISWYYSNYWTPHGHVFDSGIATQQAIARLQQEYSPELADEADVMSNGNGSLMRILPLLSIHKDLPAGERFLLTQKVSSLTHRHIRSVIACYYYLEFACLLVEGNAKHNIQVILKTEVPDLLRNIGIPP